MPRIPRRVVTGHDAQGRSVFLHDGEPPVVRTAPDGALFYELWNTDAAPARIAAQEPEPTQRDLTVPPAARGTKIRINEFPPGVVSPTHRTQTVDYGIVLEGEVVLVLDDGIVADELSAPLDPDRLAESVATLTRTPQPTSEEDPSWSRH